MTYLGLPAGMIGCPTTSRNRMLFYRATMSRLAIYGRLSDDFVPKKRASGDGVAKFLPFVLGTPLALIHYYYAYKGH
jgi:hypothetical protein